MGFEDVLLAGLARDGGLYVPEIWPTISPEEIAELAGKPYVHAATKIMRPFVEGEIPEKDFETLVEKAYEDFAHNATAPLIQTGPNQWILELFHGPTLAFKDFAMQVLAKLMDRALKARGTRATIVGATSGDTGGAAIEAFRGLEAVDIFILHPEGRVSDVQRKQMTTASEPNVHNIALNGTFDDAQTLVKQMFNDLTLRDELKLAGVNSINWARIMAQIVYYFWAASQLGAPNRTVNFSVPTGNFGDIFAGFVAKKMGLDIGRLVIATNVNDILTRTVSTGRYEPKGVVPTQSPSMDIQISSNFERLLFELSGRSAERLSELMNDLREKGTFELTEDEHHALKSEFAAYRVDESETAETMKQMYEASGYVADPHSAVGLAAANREWASNQESPMVTLATAHPAKFPDAVRAATGVTPQNPERLNAQMTMEEHFTVLENNYDVVSSFVANHSRAKSEAAE